MMENTKIATTSPSQDQRIVYYAHSKRSYNTQKERSELDLIEDQFPEAEVVNPRAFPWEELGIATGPQVMDYCLQYLRQHVDILVFSEYRGFFGRGVHQEILEAQQKGIPIYLLRKRSFLLNPRVELHDPEDWAVRYACVSDYPFSGRIKFGGIANLEAVLTQRESHALVTEFIIQFNLEFLQLKEDEICRFLDGYNYDRSVQDVQLIMWHLYYYVDRQCRDIIPLTPFCNRLRTLGFSHLTVTVQLRAKEDIVRAFGDT